MNKVNFISTNTCKECGLGPVFAPIGSKVLTCENCGATRPLEDIKEKKYTEEDLKAAFTQGRIRGVYGRLGKCTDSFKKILDNDFSDYKIWSSLTGEK